MFTIQIQKTIFYCVTYYASITIYNVLHNYCDDSVLVRLSILANRDSNDASCLVNTSN